MSDIAPVIFGPNNHSDWQIRYNDVSPNVFSKISKLLLLNYSRFVRDIISIQQFEGAEVNSNNFKVVFKGDRRRGKILLRMHKAFDTKSVNLTHDISSVLSRNGCRVSKFALNNTGGDVTRSGQEVYSVYQFVDGDHFRGTREEIIDIARELGKFDEVLYEFTGNNSGILAQKASALSKDDIFSFSRDTWEDIRSRAIRNRRSQNYDWFDELVIDYGDYLVELADRLSFHPSLPIQLVHSDLHPHNLITDGYSLKAIIDLDSIKFWERIHAIAFAIHRLVRQHFVFIGTREVNKDSVAKLRDLFLESYFRFNILDSAEIASIRYFIALEALRRATYVVKDFYYRKNTAWKNDLPKHIASLLEAEYF